jgi:hypothetical protein
MENSKVRKLSGTKLKSFKLIEEVQESFVPEQISEKLKRPKHLKGSTYKITPTSGEGSLYVTINDIVLNKGTEHEEIRPFEIFINTKNVEHFQWISALTRVMSAIFRKGGSYSFLIEELQEVFDPRGGYWSGSKLMGSIVAHIGQVLEDHVNAYKVEKEEHSEETISEETTEHSGFPDSASLCNKCRHKAVIMKDGCPTCLNCGDSKCG